MRCFFRVMGLILLLNFIASCDDGKPEKRRISPMNYDEWQVEDFSKLGMKVDLPKNDIKGDEVFGGKRWIFSVAFHAIPPPPGVLDDAKTLVEIQIERITLDEFAEQKTDYLESGMYKRGNENSHKHWLWYFDLHPETQRYDDGNYSYYRRDVKINDKEILHAHVEVINAKVPGIEEDHKAVKRILDSIVPLGIAVPLLPQPQTDAKKAPNDKVK